jgi:hypothetical protein
MTTLPNDEERHLSELVACTLNDTDLRTQRERWINVGENFGIARQEAVDGLRLTFKDHPAVAAELQALVDAENHCCTWAAWTVVREGDVLVMTARSQDEGVTTLHGMFTSVIPAAKATANSSGDMRSTRDRCDVGVFGSAMTHRGCMR